MSRTDAQIEEAAGDIEPGYNRHFGGEQVLPTATYSVQEVGAVVEALCTLVRDLRDRVRALETKGRDDY